MPMLPPYPTLSEMMAVVGEAGRRLAEIDATEGAAGNISVFLGWDVDPEPFFPIVEPYVLPAAAPEMAGGGLLVTGSGRRLREIGAAPERNLGFVKVDEGGSTGRLYTGPGRLFSKLTSEFNSHVAVHRDRIANNELNFHAIIHAQPLHLVYLSNIPRYQDTLYLNQHILRWQPEMIVNLPDGVGLVPFAVPGSSELMHGTLEAFRRHQLVLWAKHGVIVRSDTSVKRCCDLIEYAETGAQYECLNLTHHGIGEGLTSAELRAICDTYQIEQHIF